MPPLKRAKASLRLTQKDITRRRIRDAARALFVAHPFEEVAMEEVARDADVGRTTIYFHYATKNALLLDLLEEDWDRQAALFARLNQAAATDRAALRRWLRRVTEGMRQSRNLFRMYDFALSLSDDVRRLQFAHRERLIGLMSKSIPAFTPRMDAAPDRRRAAAASHALLHHLQLYGGMIAEGPAAADAEAATEVLLDAFEVFVRSYTPPATPAQ
jgi:AcrR family transcriptional regulator